MKNFSYLIPRLQGRFSNVCAFYHFQCFTCSLFSTRPPLMASELNIKYLIIKIKYLFHDDIAVMLSSV